MTILESKESSAVQTHVSMLQGIISRVANNSANCKTWAITIIAAMLVLIVSKNISFKNAWICYIPVYLFFFLDCYYLGLERIFIKKQTEFLDKIANGTSYENDLYAIKGMPKFWIQLWITIKGALSFSTLPFYGSIIIFIYTLSKSTNV